MTELNAISVGSPEEVATLAEDVLDSSRSSPIVCLTSRQGETRPALDLGEVRDIVAEPVPVYVITTGPLTRALAEALPPGLGVYGGAARIWWPNVTANSDPTDHPLVFDRYGVYGSLALERLRIAYERGAPSTRQPSTEGSRERLLQGERDSARGQLEPFKARVAELERELAAAESELGVVRREARELRKDLRQLRADHEAESTAHANGDSDGALHRAIVDEWVAALTPADRAAHALGPYRFGEEFVRSVQQLELATISRIAWVCAMVACGRAPEISGLDLHRLRTGAGGDDPQRVRASDGAEGWRCAIKRNAPAAARLNYWKLRGGMVEFASVGAHDADIPEG